ncbi:MAG TPA: HAD-IIIA family hydrolase [Caulobacteraceae bacterium]
MTDESSAPEQCVILVGGLGTRLGALTASTPKPLLPVGGRPFLEVLLREAARFGFRRILLLAGWQSDQVTSYLTESEIARELGVEIDVKVEPVPAGTGGALWQARDALDDRFFMLNGDSWFDFNWLSLVTAPWRTDTLAAIALRQIDDPSRYGVVETDGAAVRRFAERPDRPGPAAVNAGVYLLSRSIIDALTPDCSLERDGFPRLAAAGRMTSVRRSGRFIDIGVPDDLAAAQTDVPLWRRRPAVFLDRDGVINEDTGYVHRIEAFRWLPDAVEAIRRLNEAGCYVFVVTNQAGVAHGRYDEAEVAPLHDWVQAQLRERGAHVDDFRFCPFHPQAAVAAYRREHAWRKPAPGMLLDLASRWPVDMARSLMVGDKDIDVEAGVAAGVRSVKIAPGRLLREVEVFLGAAQSAAS